MNIDNLRESSDFLNILLENMTSMIFIVDENAEVAEFNRAFSEMVKKESSEIIGARCGNVIGCSISEDAGVQCGDTKECANCDLRKSIASTFTQKVPADREKISRMFNISGQRVLKHFLYTTRFIKFSEKEMVLVIVDDITEIEEANIELKELQSKIVQQEKLASIGQLAAGVAHELNNPIGFVLGNVSALSKYSKQIFEYIKVVSNTCDENIKKEAWKKYDLEYIIGDTSDLISETEEGLQRVTNIVRNLMEFARVETKMTEYDMNRGIENTLIVAANEYKYVAEIEKNLKDVEVITANGGEINEVLLNIIVNASQAIADMKYEGKKKIKIGTYQEESWIVCVIEDNGPGIKKEVIDKVFNPFFTTKPPGKGTGLGLSISYNIIVQKHKGELNVESEYGKGTKFTIKLPINKRGEANGGS